MRPAFSQQVLQHFPLNSEIVPLLEGLLQCTPLTRDMQWIYWHLRRVPHPVRGGCRALGHCTVRSEDEPRFILLRKEGIT